MPIPEIENNQKLKTFFDLIVHQTRNSDITVYDAIENLESTFPDDDLSVIRTYFQQQIESIAPHGRPQIRSQNHKRWYFGPTPGDKHWPALRDHMLNKGWNEETVNGIDQSSNYILGSIQNPANSPAKTKGLVLGYVQSGKTANFSAVIAKAADLNFDLVVILSGLTNSLRKQTQIRLNKDVFQHHLEDFTPWTTEKSDFKSDHRGAGNHLMAETTNVAIMKKNGHRLKQFIDYFKNVPPDILEGCRTLIIDDECDQASVNGAKYPDDEPTKIHALLRDIIGLFPRCAYIGYTATPFANILIEPSYPKDIYPRDFIIALDLPEEYFGAEKLFGREPLDAEQDDSMTDGLDMIRTVDDYERPFLQPLKKSEKDEFAINVNRSPSLQRAIQYFIMATAVREARGNRDQHCSMLIHTTLYAAPHLNSKPVIEVYLSRIKADFLGGNEDFIDEMRQLWETEKECVAPEQFENEPVSFEKIQELVPSVIDQIVVVVENSLVDRDERLDYTEPGQKFIVIGGNVLARGLTIEGLIVSFFMRTSTQYDTLMQMGRWFGYRVGWEDLPRIWMTSEMADYFHHMATVEAEIRDDIEEYSKVDVDPLDFAVKIRKHPDMAVCAASKMRDAIDVKISFSGEHRQTIKFSHDTDWLRSNWNAACDLVDAIEGTGTTARQKSSSYTYPGVPVDKIISFLVRYEIHESSISFNETKLQDYIHSENNRAEHSLANWNVAVVTPASSKFESEQPLGVLGPVRTSIRTRMKAVKDYINIKALMSRKDIVADLDNPPSGNPSWDDLKSFRRRQDGPDRPLLLLYPLTRQSDRETKTREPIGTEVDVMGMGIVFPQAKDHLHNAGYISANIRPDEMVEEAEYQAETENAE